MYAMSIQRILDDLDLDLVLNVNARGAEELRLGRLLVVVRQINGNGFAEPKTDSSANFGR